MLRRTRVDVGWDTTSPTKRTAHTARHRVAPRQMIERMRSMTIKPKDCGDRWYWAHTANSDVRTVAVPATGRGNVDRMNTNRARKVMAPVRNGYTVSRRIAGIPLASNTKASRRKVPGQFAEYWPRFPAGRWPDPWIAWPRLR